jgi:excisionase family DNA binding protein
MTQVEKRSMRATYTVPELASILGVAQSRVYRMAANGEIPCIRPQGSKRWIFPKAAVDRWLESAGRDVAA